MNKWNIGIILILLQAPAKGQFIEANKLNGEFGIAVGAAHYFGDLNNDYRMNRPKIALGILFRKQFGDYIALRVQGTYAKLGYSDVYSRNPVNQIRNLSFNTDLYELSLMGDFNFFRFIPGFAPYRFTPYVSLGVGFFNYDPYAYLNNEKIFLRPLGTEGQGSIAFPDRKPYGNMGIVFPIGFGIKYNISPRTNFTLELTHRFSSTDYLDDVSNTYAGADTFDPLQTGQATNALLLQDRSSIINGTPIGIKGRQRGISLRRDQYLTVMAGISINISSYECPTY
jgi:hypothetical protein